MRSTDRRHHRSAVWTALFVTVLWSTSWVLIRWGFDDEDLSPLTFAGLRYALAALVLVGVVAARSDHRRDFAALDRWTIRRLCLLGLIFYSLTQGAQFVAIDSQPAATTSLVLSLTPLVVALLGARALGEGASARQVVGAISVVFGAWIYFGGALGATLVGMFAAFVALGSNVGAALIGRSVNRGGTHAPIVITAVSMTVGALALLVVGLSVEGVPHLTGRAGAILVWLAIVNTALAFTLWNRSLVHLAALESAGINNTMLIQIAALGWIFLGEVPGVLGIIGIVVVSMGVFFTQAVSPSPSSPSSSVRPGQRADPDPRRLP
ncbi:MAG: DMT family transporter [Acidimicrobiia bacterium]|nr:DMT family transporter [Acidimicrobiia bacterium]